MSNTNPTSGGSYVVETDGTLTQTEKPTQPPRGKSEQATQKTPPLRMVHASVPTAGIKTKSDQAKE